MQLQKERENRENSSEFQDIGDETSPYLVSIIKSDSDPYDESFLLITLVFDFHLIRLDEKYRIKYQTEFGVATSPTAIVIQFED
jgi:hypothetical protein